MNRFYPRLLAAAMALAFTFAGQSAFAHSSMKSMTGKHMHSCPAGQHWVKGYKTKSGTKVHGYCRK